MEDEEDVVAVSGLVEDIRNVLQDYWVGTYSCSDQFITGTGTEHPNRWPNNKQSTIRTAG